MNTQKLYGTTILRFLSYQVRNFAPDQGESLMFKNNRIVCS